jgi:acylphosphatase
MKAVLIHITGDVQGVSFRYWAQKKAKEFNVSGWAKNDHDGGVTILAQGEKEAVNQMVTWSSDGSPLATVVKVTTTTVELAENIKGFEVK